MKALLLLLLVISNLTAQETSTGWSQRRTLPRWARQEFRYHNLDRDYTITYQLYPSYFRGDFNDDGKRDIAFFVEHKRSKKKGLIFIHGKKPQAIRTRFILLGAGRTFAGTGDNLKWISVWSFIQRRKANLLLGRNMPPDLLGDAIRVEANQGRAGLIYWNGKNYAWFSLKK